VAKILFIIPLKNYKPLIHIYQFRRINVSEIKNRRDNFGKKIHPLLLWGGLLILSVLGYIAVLYVAAHISPANTGTTTETGPQLSDDQTAMLFVVQPLSLVVFGLLFLGSLFKIIDYAVDRIFKRDVPMMWTVAGLVVTLVVLYILYTAGSSLLYQESVIGTFKQAGIAGSGLPVSADTITFKADHTFVNHRYGAAGSANSGSTDVTGTWSKESPAEAKPDTSDANRSAYAGQYKSIVPKGNQYLLTYDLGQGAMSGMEYVTVSNGKLMFFVPLDADADSGSLLYPSYVAFTKQ
jgi:hypothetical protein